MGWGWGRGWGRGWGLGWGWGRGWGRKAVELAGRAAGREEVVERACGLANGRGDVRVGRTALLIFGGNIFESQVCCTEACVGAH